MFNVERRTIMKTTKKNNYNWSFVIGHLSLITGLLLVLSGTVQATAPAYRNTYKGTKDNVQGTMYSVQSTAPAVSFQSTSAYSRQWGDGNITPMLNGDGSVNTSAYMGGPRKTTKEEPGGGINPPDEEDEDNTENGTPLGDGLLPLMLLACAFTIYKVSRRRACA